MYSFPSCLSFYLSIHNEGSVSNMYMYIPDIQATLCCMNRLSIIGKLSQHPRRVVPNWPARTPTGSNRGGLPQYFLTQPCLNHEIFVAYGKIETCALGDVAKPEEETSPFWYQRNRLRGFPPVCSPFWTSLKHFLNSAFMASFPFYIPYSIWMNQDELCIGFLRGFYSIQCIFLQCGGLLLWIYVISPYKTERKQSHYK